MFLPKTERTIHAFNLDETEGRENYEDLLNDPAVKIISKRFEKKTTSQFSEDYNSTVTETYVHVEAERCTF